MITAKFPLKNDDLRHAFWLVLTSDKVATSVMSVTSWISIKSTLGFSSNVSDRAFNEFVEYQLLDNNDIAQSLWKLAKETAEGSDDSIIARIGDPLG